MISTRRIAFVGDIGAHARLFERVLESLGCDLERAQIPADLTIVQVGDLVSLAPRRGEDSNRCLEIADRMLRANPARWIQLWGNHEIAALGGPRRPGWSGGDVNAATIASLERWWSEGLARFAFAFEDRDGPWLVTHAGLTRRRWIDAGKPPAREAADSLNAARAGAAAEIARAGSLVTGVPDERADVTWAEVTRELYEPWLQAGDRGEPLPFNQIHGHATPWQWEREAFFPDTPPRIREACHVDHAARRTTTTLGRLAGGKPAVAVSVDWVLLDHATMNGVLRPVLVRDVET
jgi:hypothetical protein